MFQEWFKDYERIIKEGREAMTKEQEEAIEYLEESILIYKNTIPKISEAIETLLSMLKEKDKKIEYYKEQKKYDDQFKHELLEQIRCLNLDKDEKDKLYHKALGDLAEADRENIQLKKQIDLMAEVIKIPEQTMKIESFDIKPKTKFGMRYLNKEEVKQYFERKASEWLK